MNLKSVEDHFIKLSKRTSKEHDFTRLHLTVPTVRAAQPLFKIEDARESLKFWAQAWETSSYFEVMSFCLYQHQHVTLKKFELKEILTWVERCQCWEHSDDLSKIYARAVEENPTWILPTLKKWNHSSHPWKRRQSVVSLLEYSRLRKKTLAFEDLIDFVNPLLRDPEYYVQKGLGWTLREIYNVYPKKTLDHIKKNLYVISPLAYSTATEKLAPEVRKKLRDQRRINRKTKA